MAKVIVTENECDWCPLTALHGHMTRADGSLGVVVLTGEQLAGRVFHCPTCGASPGGPNGVHQNSVSVWCLGCGWGRNWVVV